MENIAAIILIAIGLTPLALLITLLLNAGKPEL